MTALIGPPLSPEEIEIVKKVGEKGVTTLADAQLIAAYVPRLVAELEQSRAERRKAA